MENEQSGINSTQSKKRLREEISNEEISNEKIPKLENNTLHALSLRKSSESIDQNVNFC